MRNALSLPLTIALRGALKHPLSLWPRDRYLLALHWAFTVFNSIRVLAYLPTAWAIFSSGDSSQHSLLTWVTWFGANVTMAAWLYENNGQQANKAVAVNACNASMCLLMIGLIVAERIT
jgi:hypothetical protein